MSNVVKEVDLQQLQREYATQIHSAGKRQAWTSKRTKNISWIQNLTTQNTAGLRFQNKERLLLLAKTTAKESIYIQYPGKESVEDRKYPRPWDFRPKLKMTNGEFAKDLSFYDIWDTIYQNMNDKRIPRQYGAVLGLMFYRMAYMCDHVQEQKKAAEYTEYDTATKTYEEHKPVELAEHWNYAPPVELINFPA